MKTPLLLCLLLWHITLPKAYSQKPNKLNSADKTFSLSAIPYPCQLIEGPGEVAMVSPATFILTAPAGTDLHNPASGVWQKSNAPKLLFTPTKDFDFATKVSPSHDNLYDGGGLLLWTDNGNWAKVLLQNTGGQSVLGLSVVENQITDDSYYPVGDAREVYLRLTKKGKVFVFYYSPDGKNWTVLRQFVYHKPDQMQAGFYAQSPKGPSCKVTFSEISFVEPK